MGREIKRVPLDFDAPVGDTWAPLLMPERLHMPRCTDCSGTGATPARQWVGDIADLLLMLDCDVTAQDRGRGLHPYLSDLMQRPRQRPSRDAIEFGTGLAGRAPSFMMHDGIDSWRALEKVIRAAGLDPETWGMCAMCAATGVVEAYPGQRAEAESWEAPEIPQGDGWQLWQTVSEGGPVTPVFATADALVEHLATVGDGGGSPWSRASAEAMVASGWAPSGVVTSAGVFANGDALVEMDRT